MTTVINRKGFSQTVLCLLLVLNSSAQTTGFSGSGANIDVTYYRCEWRINPDSASKGIKGVVTVHFLTVINNISQISLDLNKTSFNNAALSVYYHGAAVSYSFPSSGNVHLIRMNLPVTLPVNTTDSLTIHYDGVPPAVAGQAEGYQKKTYAGNNYIYTLSESYEDKDWWPCKADMQDKPDSMDIFINVPSAFSAVSLGQLVDSSINGANQTFHWKTTIPVATYLVAVGVAKYRVYDRGTVNVSGTNVPVWYFIFPGKTAGTYTSILTALDHSMAELSAFSTVFGDYPFKEEKHGYYEFGWGGGMEHQSISAMGAGSLTSWGTIAHELAHQWFGDKVTFGTWNHLWLAEGFARYAEALAAELVPALGQNPVTVRSGFKSSSNNATYRNYGCYIPNGSITSSDILWSSAYGTTVYERGAMVVSMLRTLLGDTKFYQACRNFLNDPALAYRSATTDDLRFHMQNAAGGFDLTPFFDSYVFGNGYPAYNAGIGWARSGTNRITFQVTAQTKSSGSTVSYYYTPIAIRVRGALAGQDTVLVIYDQNGQLSRAGNGISTPVTGNIISFNLAFDPVTVSFDPFIQTLANGSVSMNSLLDLQMGDPVLTALASAHKVEIRLSGDETGTAIPWLQRSCDGTHFTDIKKMILVRETEQGAVYSAEDETSCSGYSWYRVRVESDAGAKFSRMVSIKINVQELVFLYPNPADQSVFVWWKAANGPVRIRISDAAGKVVTESYSGTAPVQIRTSGIPSGIYMVIVEQAGRPVYSRQLLVSHTQ